MNIRIRSLLLILVLALPAAGVASSFDVVADTTGFAAELTAFNHLAPDVRQRQGDAAQALVQPWLHQFEFKDGEARRGLYMVLAYECFTRAKANTFYLKTMFNETSNILGPALTDLEQALVLDPTLVPPRVVLGTVLVKTGRPREGINHLVKARAVLAARAAADVALDNYLRERACYYLAQGYRACGLWDEALDAVAAGHKLNPLRAYDILQGLCLAGSGRTSEAISYAVRMPAIEFRHRTALSSGVYARPSEYANRWIKSQALLAAGDLTGARHVLGDLKNYQARRMPFYQEFWQDVGLVCELLRDPEARDHYNMIAWRSAMFWAYPSTDRLFASVVLGYPDPELPVFITPDEGFEGGSPFAFLARQLETMAEVSDPTAVEDAATRGLDMCASLLRHNIQPDLVRAFRARINLAANHSELAYPDLVFAQSGFAVRGLVDPGTSILLGQQELLAGNNERSRNLFDEAISATPDNAMAWRELGVALGRAGEFAGARKAMDRALDLEPDSMEGWFNLGILAYRQHEYEQSLQSLEKAWTLEPGNQRVQKMLQTVATAQRTTARTQ